VSGSCGEAFPRQPYTRRTRWQRPKALPTPARAGSTSLTWTPRKGRGGDNLAVIERVRRAVPCRLEAGGGVRDAEAARRLLGTGVERIVVGTVLVRRPEEVAAWVRALGPRIAAGIDARDGQVRIAGWAEDTGRTDVAVASGVAGLGVRFLIYTNINRDGTLSGPDISRTNAAARAAALPTLLSGASVREGRPGRRGQRGSPRCRHNPWQSRVRVTRRPGRSFQAPPAGRRERVGPSSRVRISSATSRGERPSVSTPLPSDS